MKELFPLKQVMGFVFSLLLTVVALAVYFIDMSFTAGMTVLLVTAFIQAGFQLVVFMHAGETEDKGAIYTNILLWVNHCSSYYLWYFTDPRLGYVIWSIKESVILTLSFIMEKYFSSITMNESVNLIVLFTLNFSHHFF